MSNQISESQTIEAKLTTLNSNLTLDDTSNDGIIGYTGNADATISSDFANLSAANNNINNNNNNNVNLADLKVCEPKNYEENNFDNCRCEATGITGEQAKAIFSAAVFALSFCVIISPYVIKYLTSNFSKKKRRNKHENNTTNSSHNNDLAMNPSINNSIEESSTEHEDEMPTWLCFLNAFGAGCFLSVSLLEFMPIVIDRTPTDINFPLGLFSVGVGFLILAMMEHLDLDGICNFCKRSVCGNKKKGKQGNCENDEGQVKPLNENGMEIVENLLVWEGCSFDLGV